MRNDGDCNAAQWARAAENQARLAWASGHQWSGYEACYWMVASLEAAEWASDPVAWVWRERYRALLSWMSAAGAAPDKDPEESDCAEWLAGCAASATELLRAGMAPPMGGAEWVRRVLSGLRSALMISGASYFCDRLARGWVVPWDRVPAGNAVVTEFPARVARSLATWLSQHSHDTLDSRRADPLDVLFLLGWTRDKSAHGVLSILLRSRDPCARLWLTELAVAYRLGVLPGTQRPGAHEVNRRVEHFARASWRWKERFAFAAREEAFPESGDFVGAALREMVASAVTDVPPLERLLAETDWPVALGFARSDAALFRRTGTLAKPRYPRVSTLRHGLFVYLASNVPCSGSLAVDAFGSEGLAECAELAYELGARVRWERAGPRMPDWPRTGTTLDLERRTGQELRAAWSVIWSYLVALGVPAAPFAHLLVSFYTSKRPEATNALLARVVAQSPLAAAAVRELAVGFLHMSSVSFATLGTEAARWQAEAVCRGRASQKAAGVFMWCSVCLRPRVTYDRVSKKPVRPGRQQADGSAGAGGARQKNVEGTEKTLVRINDPVALLLDPDRPLAVLTCAEKSEVTAAACQSTELQAVSLVGRILFLNRQCFAICCQCTIFFRPDSRSVWRNGGPVCKPCGRLAARPRESNEARQKAGRKKAVRAARGQPEAGASLPSKRAAEAARRRPALRSLISEDLRRVRSGRAAAAADE